MITTIRHQKSACSYGDYLEPLSQLSSVNGRAAGTRALAIGRCNARTKNTSYSMFSGKRPIYSVVLRNRSALPITETELKLIAALAIIGLSTMPNHGNSAPAAIGTPMKL